MAKVLVTGGAGFIGSNLSERLVKEGHDVVVVDDCFLGQIENLSGILNKVEFVKASVLEKETLGRVIKDIDYVFHEAAISSAPLLEKDPRKGMNVNVQGFMNIMEAARNAKVKRVVYASTSSLYSSVEPPQSESASVKASSWYELSMLFRERISKLYFERYGFESVGLRYFSVYGPKEKAKGRFANLVSQFLWEMMSGREPVIYGDGEQMRDFVYVDDVVEANLLAIRKGGIGGEIFNVGGGKSFTLNELIEILREELDVEIEAEYVKNPIENYVEKTLADTRKAEGILGFKAEISLREGINKLIELST